MLNQLTTSFIARLRARDEAAWFELWETFGPVLRAQLSKWGKGAIGSQTVRDLSQETLAALSDSIDRYDPGRGARFSTWLLSIAKHTLGDEIDRRMAQKRGRGKRAGALDDSWMGAAPGLKPDEQYEAAVFRAKVERAIRLVEKESEFLNFQIYRMRVLDGLEGKAVAEQLGVSEPTVSRRLAKVRDALREKLREVISTYSFTAEEQQEAERHGLPAPVAKPRPASERNPDEPPAPKSEDALFDEAVAEIYHRQQELRRQDQARMMQP